MSDEDSEEAPEPEPEPGPAVPSGADRIRAIGEAAERLAQAAGQREAQPLRQRVLSDFEVRRAHNRHVRRHLWEMARRFEDYQSVYDCARELRDFVQTIGGPLTTRGTPRKPPREQVRRFPDDDAPERTDDEA